MSLSRWKCFNIALKASISVAVLWFILFKIQKNDIEFKIDFLNFKIFFFVAALLFAQPLIGAYRWMLIAKWLGMDLPFLTAVQLYFEASFFNQALPSTIGGDVVRAMRAHSITSRKRTSLQSVFLDRISGLTGLLIFTLSSLYWSLKLINDKYINEGLILFIALGIIAFAIFILIGIFKLRENTFRILGEFVNLSRLTQKLLNSKVGIMVQLISIFGHFLTAFTFFIIAKSVGVDLSLLSAVLLIPIAMLVTMIPFSLAGWGLREGAIITLLAFVGIQAEAAFRISVLFGLMMIIVALPGGLFWTFGTMKAKKSESFQTHPPHQP